MADLATKRRLARRAWWKHWGLPLLAAVAALFATAFLDYRPLAALFNLAQVVLLATVNSSETELIAGHPILQRLLDWIAAPAVWFVLTLGFVSLPPIRYFINYILPDPPAFVFGDLDEQRRRSKILIERSVTDFIGRQKELKLLHTLLDRNALTSPFRWRVLLGPSGIGKTRLAIEWLASAQAEGWDVGIVDPKDYSQLADWKPRRPTALVIDEALWRWGKGLAAAMLALGDGASARRPLRLVLLDQMIPNIILPDGAEQERLDRSQLDPPLILGRMEEEDVRALVDRHAAPVTVVDRIVEESAGRPRAAIILANIPDAVTYAEALHRWADLLVPELTDDSTTPTLGLSVPLIFAALVGPVSADLVRQHIGEYYPGPLLRFFDNVSREDLERELPELLPDDLAQELALRLLPKLDPPGRNAIIATMLSQASGRIEASLAAIWRGRPDLGRPNRDSVAASTLRQLQDSFDKIYPERVLALVEQLDLLVDEVREATTPRDLEVALAALVSVTDARPFDPAIRLYEASGVVSAINVYGDAQRWNDLERWGKRLIALAEDERFSADPAIRLEEAMSAINAISVYGWAQRWNDLERWGERLIALAEDERFSADPAIRLEEAKGAVNAINHYGDAQRWGDFQRWGKRLIGLVEDERFASDPAIRLCEAINVVNAISVYGQVRYWNDLERWGNRLIALVEDDRFANDPAIRVEEAASAGNAILYYGWEQRWNDLERWGGRLIALAEDERFGDDPAIRIREAIGAVNAVNGYGRACCWDELERWGRRLIAVAKDERFADDPAIRCEEAKGAVNAINDYGGAQRWDDLERWGERLITLVDNEPFVNDLAIRREEARGVFNAIIAYSAARRWNDLERWGKRLIALVEDERFANDPAIRLEEAKGAVNALTDYGEAHRWNDLERWGKRLIALAEDERFAADPAIRLEEAKGAANAVSLYGEAGLHGRDREFAWKRRIAHVAQVFPFDAQIQELAKYFDLMWASQQARAFAPYGRSNQLSILQQAEPKPIAASIETVRIRGTIIRERNNSG